MKLRKKKGKEKAANWKEFWQLLKSVRMPWIWILVAFLCNMAYSEVNLLLPTTTAGLLSGSLDPQVLIDAIWFYVAYTIVLCADTALRCPAQHFAARNARRTLWKRMLNIRMDYYFENNPSNLMSTVTNDASEAMKRLVQYIVGIIPAIYYVVRALSTVSSYNVWLMLALLLLLPVKVAYMIFIGRCRFRTQNGLYQRIGGLTAYLAERVRNLSLIKTYTSEEQELKNGEAVAKELFQANMRVTKLECGISALSTLIGLLQNMIVMVFGVLLLNQGMITMQEWVAFFMYSATISNNFDTLISYWTDLKTIQGTLARAAHLNVAPVEEEGESKALPQGKDIVFDHVSFSYGDKKALDDVSFTIPAGSATAIVGLCGSGKTTSISLIERFYQPDSGEVRVGGVSVSDVTPKELRKRFGYAQQGADIFSGTLREALTYGIHRQVSDQEILEAAKQSGFYDTIQAWDDGLDTMIAANGSSLSGGQRQRLVLTREFLRNGEILLLDEPTSALDAVAAKSVQDTIYQLFQGKTKVIVTHDLSMMEQADQIVVLSAGAVAGCGTYEELNQTCPLFQELVATQTQGEEEAAC